MKKSKPLSIPANIPKASGIFLAKNLAKITSIILIAISIIAIFFNKEAFAIFIVKSSLFIIPASLIFGYIMGRLDKKEQLKYLENLRDKCSKKIEILEAESKIDYLADRADSIVSARMEAKRVAIFNFFHPLVKNFLVIRTTKSNREENFSDFKKAMNIFSKAMSETKVELFKQLGEKLEQDLLYHTYNAIHDRKKNKFDSNWMKIWDCNKAKKQIYDDVSYELYIKKSEFYDFFDKIKTVIYRHEQAMA